MVVSDVVQLLNVFLKVDDDRSEMVDSLEFLMFCDLERTPFSERVFNIFDHDLSGELDFVEFVCAIWNFCSMDDVEVISFTFECFANRNSATKEWLLDGQGVTFLMDSLFDADTQTHKITSEYFNAIIYTHGCVTEREWTKWTQHNRRSLRPFLSLRNQMRSRCVGKTFWKRGARRPCTHRFEPRHVIRHMHMHVLRRQPACGSSRAVAGAVPAPRGRVQPREGQRGRATQVVFSLDQQR